jgi:hypothetical protein
VHDAAGWTLVASASAVALLTALVLRSRLPALAVLAVLTACGLALGGGAILVQDHVSPTNAAVTLTLVTVLVPAHVRVVLGRFGPAAHGTARP